jgi:hypothetical protein
LCKEKPVRFGKYQFSSSEIVPAIGKPEFTLKQQVLCGAVPAGPQVALPPTTSNWRPTDADEWMIESLTYQYFRARDSGEYRQAYLLFKPGVIEWDHWRDLTAKFNADAGAVKSRQIRKVTWVVDPPTGPPGTYAAVDYSSTFENLFLHCGYVVWHRQPSGSFALVREEQNAIARTTAEKMTPENLQSVRARFGC